MSDEMVSCVCGCGQTRPRYDSKGNERLFISGHNDIWKNRRKPAVKCPQCGIEFRPRGVNTKSKPTYLQQYCSAKCWYASNVGQANAKYNLREVVCAECGTKMLRKPSQMARSKTGNYYCSKLCRSRAAQKRGTKVPTKSLMSSIMKRDGDGCVVCGFSEVIQVHHIIPRREMGSNDPSNLITLCPNHHKLADLGRLPREALLRLVSKS